jgi:hypothetical protein
LLSSCIFLAITEQLEKIQKNAYIHFF